MVVDARTKSSRFFFFIVRKKNPSDTTEVKLFTGELMPQGLTDIFLHCCLSVIERRYTPEAGVGGQ